MYQVIIGGNADALNQTADEYNALMGSSTWTSTANNRTQVIPANGYLSNLQVEVSQAPGTFPYVFTVYVGGVASAMVAIIQSDDTYGVYTGDPIDVGPGDRVYIGVSTPDGAPDNAPSARWSCLFQGDNANESILLGCGVTTKTATVYCPVSGTYAAASVEDRAYEIIPTPGVLKDLYVWMSAGAGTDPDAYTFTLRKGGDNTTLTKSIVADSTTGYDTDHDVAVVAGDYVDLAMVPIDSPANGPVAGWGIIFAPTTDGESLILGCSYDNPTNSQTEYNYLQTGAYNNAWSTTENPQGGQAHLYGVDLKKLYVKLENAPGAGNTWTFTVRGTGPASTTITVPITGTDTTGNDTAHTYTLTDYDDLAIMAVPDSSPTTGMVYWGLVAMVEESPPPFVIGVTSITGITSIRC